MEDDDSVSVESGLSESPHLPLIVRSWDSHSPSVVWYTAVQDVTVHSSTVQYSTVHSKVCGTVSSRK